MSTSVWDATSLPKFSAIDVDAIEADLTQLLDKNRKTMAACVAQDGPLTWENFVLPLDQINDELGVFWSPISHLNSVKNSPELRDAYNACLPKLTQYYTEIGQNYALYQGYKTLLAQADQVNYSVAQKEALTQEVRGFELSGVGLEGEAKERYGEINQRLSELSSSFGENVLDSTQAWSKLVTDEAELAGLPDSAMAQAKQMAQAKEKEGWLFTLDFPSYMPVLNYADNQALREELYTAFATRASDTSPVGVQYDNAPLIDEILALRHEMAGLLGFDNYAELSVATKMAENGEQVIGFLNDLAVKGKPAAEKDLLQIKEFALQEYGVGELNSWDIGYYAEKLREHKFSISQEAFTSLFPD